jgi:hypothetical protein
MFFDWLDTDNSAAGCPAAIVQMATDVRSRYASNTNGSIVDSDRSNNYETAVLPLRAARRSFAKMANRYSETGDTAHALATGNCLADWVKEEALTQFFNHGSSEPDHGNHLVQQFNLSLTLPAVAMSYAQIKNVLPESQRQLIEQWLLRIDATLEDPTEVAKAQHNHTYWIGAAHAAIGYVTHNQALFDKGYQMVQQGINAIDSDLLFPAEANRGAFSLGYQFFAAIPLLLVAELGMTQGKNLYAERDGIMGKVINQRLLPAMAGDTATLALMQQRAGGYAQKPVKFVNLPALALYNQRFPNPSSEDIVNRYIQLLSENADQTMRPTPIDRGKKSERLPTIHDLFAPEYGGLVRLLYPFAGQ